MVTLLSGLLTLWTPSCCAQAQSPPEPKEEGGIGEWWKKLERGIVDPIKGIRYYWQEGLHIDSDREKIRLKIGGKFMADGGKIDADGTMKNAFPGIEEEKEGIVFRRLEAYVLGTLWDRLDFKFEMDFANIREIKDLWMDFRKIPYLGQLRVGHFGQPMSLEDQNSSRDITFMERALPVLAFPPGLDMGVMAINTAFGQRMTWAAPAANSECRIESRNRKMVNPKPIMERAVRIQPLRVRSAAIWVRSRARTSTSLGGVSIISSILQNRSGFEIGLFPLILGNPGHGCYAAVTPRFPGNGPIHHMEFIALRVQA